MLTYINCDLSLKFLVKSDTSTMQEIKQLQEKLAFLEKKDQEYLQLKNTNTILCNKVNLLVG